MNTKRMKIALGILASFLASSCSGQTIKYEAMKEGNVKVPVMAQHLQGLNVLIDKSSEKSVYLSSAYKGENNEFSLLSGEFNPIIAYQLRVESGTGLSQSFINITSVFTLEDDGRYRIMESGYINSAAHRQSAADMWAEDRLAPPQPSEPRLVGYSDDTTLYAVRVLQYLYEHRVEPTIYNENQVEQQPLAVSSSNRLIPSGTEKEIEKWLRNPPEYYLDKLDLNGVKGKITLSYLIDEYGQVAHIKLEQTSIRKTESISGICREVSIALKGIRWKPAQLNGKPVVVKREITIKM